MRGSTLTVTALLFGFAACRSAPVIGEPSVISSAPVPSVASPRRAGAGGAPSASASTPSAGRFHEPIADRPFPEGATDEMVCAAIHSTEKDPWLRFGHIIPFYVDGTVWVGEGNTQDLTATLHAIDLYAPNMFSGRGKACSRGGLLVYAEGLRDGAQTSTGRTFTVAGLEAGTLERAPVAKRVLGERFVATQKDGMLRLQQLCRDDAPLCAQARRLFNFGPDVPVQGLCYDVFSMAESFFAETDHHWWTTRKDSKLDGPALIAACRRLTPADQACSLGARGRAEREACWKTLAPKLGL